MPIATTTTLIIWGILSGSLGLAGYKYYQHYQEEQEYKKLYESFMQYSSNNVIFEYETPRDEYEPFRVVHFKSISDFELP